MWVPLFSLWWLPPPSHPIPSPVAAAVAAAIRSPQRNRPCSIRGKFRHPIAAVAAAAAAARESSAERNVLG
ncbi:hypothetical protein M0804_011298 [Polistes exclamans]|nr:hypothetical protein M0804_011298 [Polistes exclamans]